MLSQSGLNVFTFEQPDNVYNKLPVGTYSVAFSPMIGYFLQKKQDFIVPQKIYGSTAHIDRWIKVQNEIDKNLGILLSGIKGGGKTLDAKLFCTKSKRPVIIIDTPMTDSAFFSFLQNPAFRGAVLFFDEFEKVYKTPELQNSLLTLFDGVYNTKFTFLLTINQPTISEYFFNRPSRIKYLKEYNDISYNTIREICDDKLQNKEHADSVVDFFSTIGSRSMDMIMEIINEVNLFNEPATVCGEFFNLQTEPVSYSGTIRYFNGVETSYYSRKITLNKDYFIPISPFLTHEIKEKIYKDLFASIKKDKSKMIKNFEKFNINVDDIIEGCLDFPDEADQYSEIIASFNNYLYHFECRPRNSILTRNKEQFTLQTPLFTLTADPINVSRNLFNRE